MINNREVKSSGVHNPQITCTAMMLAMAVRSARVLRAFSHDYENRDTRERAALTFTKKLSEKNATNRSTLFPKGISRLMRLQRVEFPKNTAVYYHAPCRLNYW